MQLNSFCLSRIITADYGVVRVRTTTIGTSDVKLVLSRVKPPGSCRAAQRTASMDAWNNGLSSRASGNFNVALFESACSGNRQTSFRYCQGKQAKAGSVDTIKASAGVRKLW